jgi:hypothetical protein
MLSFPLSSELFKNAIGYDFSGYSKVLRAMATSRDRMAQIDQARSILEKDAPFFGMLGLNSFGCVWDFVDGFAPGMLESVSYANVSIRR